MITPYEQEAYTEMRRWRRHMQRPPNFTGRVTKRVQERINGIIPEKVHEVITTAFKGMTQAVLSGSGFITGKPLQNASLEIREARVEERISFYKTASAAEGAVTGAGGILLGLADFPLWLTLKMKMMFDIAALYGYDTDDPAERLYLLYAFQLAFSSRGHRRLVFDKVAAWDVPAAVASHDPKNMDWRSFQQEYRDYLDVAKLLQLIPGIGAAVGAVVNHRLTDKLGHSAMNAYRLRWFSPQNQLSPLLS